MKAVAYLNKKNLGWSKYAVSAQINIWFLDISSLSVGTQWY